MWNGRVGGTSECRGGNDDRIERHKVFPPFGNFLPESFSIRIETTHRIVAGGSFPLFTSLEVADVDLEISIFRSQVNNFGLKRVHHGLQTN